MSTMEVRFCPQGHVVPQANLKACPACGGSLAEAEFVEVDPATLPIAPTAAFVVTRPDQGGPETAPGEAAIKGLPSGIVFIFFGAIIGLLGWLTTAFSDGKGMEVGMGIVLLALSGVLTSIGVIAVGVKLGMDDARQR